MYKLLTRGLVAAIGNGSFTQVRAFHLYIYPTHMYVDTALRKPGSSISHVFKQLYFVGQRERQLIMHLLDICVSYSTYLAISTAHNGPEFSLNYLIDYTIGLIIIT